MGQRQRTERTDRIDKQRMRPIERIDVTVAIADSRPTRRLDRARYLESQFAKILFPLIARHFSFPHQPPKVAVSGDVVESVIMHTDMRHVTRHYFDRFPAAQLEKLLLT